MAAQTVILAGKSYVLLPEAEYRRLNRKKSGSGGEDRRDAMILRRRLADMRRRGEKPVEYARVRREMGME